MIAHTTKEILVNWLQRDFCFTEKEARYELGFLMNSNGRPVTRDYYLTVRRVGATITLTRKDRGEIWESFQNAQNHGNFIDGFVVAA